MQVRGPDSDLCSTAYHLTVVWKITPLIAEWITNPSQLFLKHNILDSHSTVVELGCGISGIIGLCLGPLVESYVLTDQDYVMKLLSRNLAENQQVRSRSKGRKSAVKPKKENSDQSLKASNVMAKSLDWEQDEVTSSLTGSDSKGSFDVVIACDCIYNDALIKPLMETCVDACKLRQADGLDKPTVCLVAQQLRSAEVFEAWLKEFHKAFSVWRIPDEELIERLRSDSGFVVHLGILR